MKTAGFDQSEYKIVEYLLTRASPQRLLALIKKHTKDQFHPADWYIPFVKNGYVKSDYAFDCSFDEDFWKAYQILDSVCELHTFDLPYIDQMKVSHCRLRKALHNSKVMNVKYIYRVWQGVEEEKTVNNIDKVQKVFKSDVVKVVNL